MRSVGGHVENGRPARTGARPQASFGSKFARPVSDREAAAWASAARPAAARPAAPAARPATAPTRPAPARPTAAARPSARPAVAARPRHIDALDGLRTLAILSVVLYHLGVRWLPSGHMGVVMFLVLTGYLVTSSVVREFARDGRVRLGRLWARRFRRVWPAMALMVVVILLACVTANHVLLTKMRPDVLPALALVPNLSYIVRGVSYFDQIGGPSPLTHLWYVGLDAQMAIVLPILLLLGLRVATRGTGRLGARGRVTLACVCLALAVASAVLMGVLYVPGQDPSRVYYGPDTRAFSVLMGAALALVWPLGGTPVAGGALLGARVPSSTPVRASASAPVPARPSAPAQLLGVVALVALVVFMAVVPADATFLYRGGMVLASLLSCALLAALMVPGTIVARLLSLRPVVWLGRRSYGVYLWHYPLIILLGAAGGPWWLAVAAVVASVALAQVSWVGLEAPLADGRAAAGLRALVDGSASRGRVALRVVPACALLAVVLLDVAGVALIPPVTLVPKDAIRSTGASAGAAMDLSQRQASISANAGGAAATGDAASGTSPAELAGARGSLRGLREASDQPAVAPALAGLDRQALTTGAITLTGLASETTYEPLLIADSVAGDASDYWYAHAPEGLLDSYVGRTPDQALQVLDDYLAQGVVGRIVVIASFSNNVPSDETLDQMVADCGPDRSVYLVNVHIPEVEQDVINDQLDACASRHANVHVIDWHGLATGNEGAWLYDDMTHLRPEGVQPYVDMITNAIADDWLADGGAVTPDPAVAADVGPLTAADIAAAGTSGTSDAAGTSSAATGALPATPTVVRAAPSIVAAGAYDPVIIGDSVPGDTPFYDMFPDGLSDCYVGRRPLEAISVYQGYQAQGVVGNVVIFASFSNTTPFPDQLEQLVASVDPTKQVYLVGTVNPEGFQDDANANLIACADAHPNVHYVDWPAACAGHEDDYLYDDATHLTPDGAQAYLEMLAQAVAPDVVAAGGSVE